MIFLCRCRIADAEENLGESEVREAHLAKSLFFIRIGDKVRTDGGKPFRLIVPSDFFRARDAFVL